MKKVFLTSGPGVFRIVQEMRYWPMAAVYHIIMEVGGHIESPLLETI